MSIAISVLVPVYNVEKTLDRCLESILKQTFTDYEVILVNDGSTDNSGAICDRYAAKYDNIRVIHKNNEGLGPTRNRAICEAKGEYIYHCDSDDWLKETLLADAYNAIVTHDADVLVFGYDIFTEDRGVLSLYNSIRVKKDLYTSQKEIRNFFVQQYYNAFVVLSACNRMYKRSFLIENELFFPPLRRCQDMAYSLLLFDNINRLATIDESYYCYIIEPGVFKGRSYHEMLDIYFTVYEQTASYFEKWGMFVEDEKIKLNNYLCEQIANYSAFAFEVKFKDEKEPIKLLLSEKRVTKCFKQYKNVKHSKFMTLFCLAIHLKSVSFMKLICRLVRKKGESNA